MESSGGGRRGGRGGGGGGGELGERDGEEGEGLGFGLGGVSGKMLSGGYCKINNALEFFVLRIKIKFKTRSYK